MDGVSVSRSRCFRVVLVAGESRASRQSGACTPYIGTTSKSFLRQAREPRSQHPLHRLRQARVAVALRRPGAEGRGGQDPGRQARGRSRAGGGPRGHHPESGQPGRSPRPRRHHQGGQRHRQRGDPGRGLPRARQGRPARGRHDARQDHDGRQARGLPDRGDRGDRQPEGPGPADLCRSFSTAWTTTTRRSAISACGRCGRSPSKDFGIDPAAWRRELEPMLAATPAATDRQARGTPTKIATQAAAARSERGRLERLAPLRPTLRPVVARCSPWLDRRAPCDNRRSLPRTGCAAGVGERAAQRRIARLGPAAARVVEGDMDTHTLELLEFDKVRALVAARAACSLGKAAAQRIEPSRRPRRDPRPAGADDRDGRGPRAPA